MHPVVLRNEFNDREASGHHPSQWARSLPREQEGEKQGLYREAEERENQTEKKRRSRIGSGKQNKLKK